MSDMSDTDSDIKIAAARVAFSRACLRHRANLFGAALRFCRSRDRADDLVQDTLLRALVNWRKFAPQGSPQGCDAVGATGATTPIQPHHPPANLPAESLGRWLLRIMRNEFIDGYRARRRHARLLEERPVDAREALHDATAQSRANPESAVLSAAPVSPEVMTALGRLRPDHRELIERADLRGETYAGIAAATGIPIGTVMSRLHRARRSLGDDLRDIARRDYGLRAAQAGNAAAS